MTTQPIANAEIDKIDPEVIFALEKRIAPVRALIGDAVLAKHLYAMAQLMGDATDPARVSRVASNTYFLQAWDMWPKAGRGRSRKTKAREHFHVISLRIGPQSLLQAIHRFTLSRDVLKDDGAYTPGLDRWLTQGRWEAWLEDVSVKRVGFV